MTVSGHPRDLSFAAGYRLFLKNLRVTTMPLSFPADLQTLLDSARALIRDPGFWWEVGVLVLAAAGALLVHRTLG